eukprot:m.276099 g.276099  ORF g.276099 m.276099 type:complete len:421 (-) comp17693_c2_seq4:5972-7234(-)
MSSAIKPSKFYGSRRTSSSSSSSGRLIKPTAKETPQDVMDVAEDDDEPSGPASPITVENNEVRLSNRSQDPKQASPWRWTSEPVVPPSSTDSLSDSEFAALEDGLALFYDRIQRDDIIISIGDSVLLEAAESSQPYVARVVRMYEHLAEAAMYLTIRWYLRPEETKRGRLPEHGQDELFFMTQEAKPSTYSIDCVDSPCTVLTYGSYCRFRAECRRLQVCGKPPTEHYPVFFISDQTLAKRNRHRGSGRPRRTQANGAASSPSAAHPVKAPKHEDRINKRNGKGETKLHMAASRGDASLVRMLIAQGAYIDIQDFAGWTPLHEACAQGHTEVVDELLKHGASTAVIGPEGVRPLHDAAEMGFGAIVETLLRNGADPQASTEAGEKALDLTTDPKIIQMLSTVRRRRTAANKASRAIMQTR